MSVEYAAYLRQQGWNDASIESLARYDAEHGIDQNVALQEARSKDAALANAKAGIAEERARRERAEEELRRLRETGNQ